MDGGTQVVSRGQSAYFQGVMAKSASYHKRLTHEVAMYNQIKSQSFISGQLDPHGLAQSCLPDHFCSATTIRAGTYNLLLIIDKYCSGEKARLGLAMDIALGTLNRTLFGC